MKTITVYMKPDRAERWLDKGPQWYEPVVYQHTPDRCLAKVTVPETALQGGWFHPANCPGIDGVARKALRAITTVTRDGIEVKPGQIWRDCDKRCPKRILIVDRVEPGYAFMRGMQHGHLRYGRQVRVSISRMHPHSTGFELQS